VEPANIESSNLLSKINKMATELGIENPKEVTVVKLEDTDDPNKKTLELIQGSWDNSAPWFVVTKGDKVYILSSLEAVLHLIKSMQDAKYETFNLKLEKAILENLPVDFNDVWVVAMSEIQSRLSKTKNKNLLDIDIRKLVQDIKRHHPNLFLRLKDFPFPPQGR